MGLINFIKPSLQGNDDKASARALTNFWYVFLNSSISVATVVLAYMIVLTKNESKYAVDILWILVWLIISYNITVLVIYGIVSFQNLTEMARAIRGQPASPIQVETKTTTEITQPKAPIVEDKKSDAGE